MKYSIIHVVLSCVFGTNSKNVRNIENLRDKLTHFKTIKGLVYTPFCDFRFCVWSH